MATKIKTSITLSQDALDELEALSANDTHRYSGSSVVESLIHQAYAARADHLKRVDAIKNDQGRTIGWAAFYDGRLIIETDGAGSKPQAQKALDAFVFEELSK